MSRPAKSELPKELALVLKILSKNVRSLRKEKDLSQANLAKAAGISVTTLNEFESKGHRDIRVSTLVSIAETLDVSVIDLFLSSEHPTSSSEMEQLLQVSRTLNKLVQKKSKK